MSSVIQLEKLLQITRLVRLNKNKQTNKNHYESRHVKPSQGKKRVKYPKKYDHTMEAYKSIFPSLCATVAKQTGLVHSRVARTKELK